MTSPDNWLTESPEPSQTQRQKTPRCPGPALRAEDGEASRPDRRTEEGSLTISDDEYFRHSAARAPRDFKGVITNRQHHRAFEDWILVRVDAAKKAAVKRVLDAIPRHRDPLTVLLESRGVQGATLFNDLCRAGDLRPSVLRQAIKQAQQKMREQAKAASECGG